LLVVRKVGRGVAVAGRRYGGWESIRVSLVVMLLGLVGSDDGSSVD